MKYKIHVADDRNLQERIPARFRDLSLAVGEPEDGLTPVHGQDGHMTDIFLDEAAAERLPELLEEFPYWEKILNPES